jgi:succinate-acetate transporter protein
MYSMVSVGWFPPAVLGSSAMDGIAAFVKIALLVTALASFLRGDSWHGCFFMFWCAIWWGFRSAPGDPLGYVGWYFLGIALVSLFLWMGATRSGLDLPVRLVSLSVSVAFALWALGHWFARDIFLLVGGYVGLVTALLTFWAALVEIPGAGAPAAQGSGAPAA